MEFELVAEAPGKGVRNPADHRKLHISDVLDTCLRDIPVSIADHCYGCTAGQGSSCGGALA